MKNPNRENILVSWVVWHFVQMPKFLFLIWKNYILFSLEFFSAPLLLATLFSPWKKEAWGYSKGLDIGKFFYTLFGNIISRIMGAICRVILIVLSIVALALILVAGFVTILIWILLPFIFISLILFAFYI